MIELADVSDADLVAERNRGVGGSDAGAVLGVNRWKTRLDVWLEKVEGYGVEETEIMRWGRILEAPVAAEWSRRTGHPLAPSPTLWHPVHDWMLAHVDRLGVLVDSSQPFVYEGKLAGANLASTWGASGQTFETAAAAADHVPAHVVAQACHYMAVTDVDLAVVAVFIGGQELRWYWLRRDRGFEDLLIEAERRFWIDEVRTRVAPPATTLADVEALYPKADGSAVVADADCIRYVQAYAAANAAIKAADDQKDEARFRITRFMGAATELTTVDGDRLATWRQEGNRRRRTFRAAALHQEER